MDIRPLPAEEPAVRRYVEDLWLPYHRDLSAAVDSHALADDVDLVDAEVDFRLDRLASEGYRAWVAVEADADGRPGDGDPFADADAGADLAGFVTVEVDEAPTVFDRPDRLRVGDVYVREQYRGTGLARDLIERAADRARDAGCAQLVLDVDADNERANAFYEKLGFETYRREMTLDVADL